MIDLAAARSIRARLASGDPPEGWPRITSLLVPEERRGQPVPKCGIIACDQPGILEVSHRALTILYGAANAPACPEHYHHLSEGGASIVSGVKRAT